MLKGGSLTGRIYLGLLGLLGLLAAQSPWGLLAMLGCGVAFWG